MESIKPILNEAENGNKSKPLLADARLIKFLNKKNQILKLIPKGNVSVKNMILSFEKIEEITRKNNEIQLFDLSEILYKIKDKDFNFLNEYFKKVHKIIRKEAIKSKFYDENLLIVAINNYKDNTGFYFGKNQLEKAYSKTLDFYDPNKKQSKKELIFNWNGFWSLISTKNGLITGCFLGDTMDREIFYEALK